MEIQAPKKEKKFLKSIGRIAGVLAQELVLGLGRKYIGKMINKIKIPKKKETLSFLLLISCTFAFAQYPATGNKQRLGYQTSGDGLVFRGRSSDTTALKPSTINNAYHLFDTVNNVLFSYIKTKGGWNFNNSDTVIIQGATMPFDSITFNTAKDGTVGVGEVEYNDSQGSLIQGLKGGNVTNVIGQQLHQRVSNVTGSTLSKGTAVYLSGSQGNRITAAKALATSDPTSANTFGIVAESIADNASGYVITEGLITGINTSGLTEDSAVYLSPTVAGGLTSTKPQAPNHGVYIGICVKSNAGSGELFVKIKNGLELDELHDVLITSPASNASLYYKSSEGIWRDTTAALLVSDTATMLTNYLRTGVAASTYLTQSNAASTYLPLTGGTLTGLLKNTSQRLTGNITISDFDVNYSSVQIAPSSSATVNLAIQQNITGAANISMGGNQGGGGEPFNPNIYFTDNRKAYASIGGIHTSSGTNNQSGHIVFNTTPSLNTIALTERMRIAQDGAITMGGTLGVTGATTLSSPLTVNSSAVFNEGSADADFRVESDGNANMVFVDASTDRVGIGTNTPSKTLDVNGEVKIVTTSVTPTVLLGKDANNVVGQLYIDGGLSIIGSNLYGIKPYYTSDNSTSQTFESNFMNTVSSAYLKINQNSTVTITLPSATNNGGKSFTIKNLGTGAVNSNSSNVEPQNSTTLGTAILGSGGSKWATLVSDGTNWVIMQSN